jgi:hydroxypyruvate isomerase
LKALPESCALAKELGSRSLIILAGDHLAGVPDGDQRQALTDALVQAAEIAASYGVTLVLEPLNTRVDHPGYFLDSTDEALAIIGDVSSTHLRLLYDVYHSFTMGEDVAAVVARAGPLIGYVHVADAPGRHEPGTGLIDWQLVLDALARCDYDGPIGLEYMPTVDSGESLRLIRDALGSQERRTNQGRGTTLVTNRGRTSDEYRA